MRRFYDIYRTCPKHEDLILGSCNAMLDHISFWGFKVQNVRNMSNIIFLCEIIYSSSFYVRWFFFTFIMSKTRRFYSRQLQCYRYFRLIHSNFLVYHVKLLNDLHGEVDLANKEFWGLDLPIPVFFKFLNFYMVTHFKNRVYFDDKKKKNSFEILIIFNFYN